MKEVNNSHVGLTRFRLREGPFSFLKPDEKKDRFKDALSVGKKGGIRFRKTILKLKNAAIKKEVPIVKQKFVTCIFSSYHNSNG